MQSPVSIRVSDYSLVARKHLVSETDHSNVMCTKGNVALTIDSKINAIASVGLHTPLFVNSHTGVTSCLRRTRGKTAVISAGNHCAISVPLVSPVT